MFFFSMALTVVSNTLYHLIQKLTPSTANPVLTLAVTYATAATICLVLLPFFPLQTGLATAVRQLNWSSLALGGAIVGLELGFLMAYRVGWNVSLGAIVSNVAVTVLLVPIGLVVFREKVTAANVVGIVVCIIGLALINRK